MLQDITKGEKDMKEKIVANIQKYMVIVILVVLMAFFSILAPNFLTVNNLFTVLRQVSMIGILSVGGAFIMISGGIDLSLGVQMGMSGIIAAILMVNHGMPILISCLAGVFATTIVGFLNGIIITTTNMQPLIATLGMMNIVKGINYIITDGLPIYGLPSNITVLGQGHIGPVPVPSIVMVLIFCVGGFLLNKTYLGRYFYALGSNEEAARLTGLNTKKIRILAYTIGGVLGGVAGLVLMARVNSAQPMSGWGNEMDVITACVVGGVSAAGGEGKMSGVVAGVLIMGVLSNGMAVLGLGEYHQVVVKGVVLILAVGFDCMQRIWGAKVKKIES